LTAEVKLYFFYRGGLTFVYCR